MFQPIMNDDQIKVLRAMGCIQITLPCGHSRWASEGLSDATIAMLVKDPCLICPSRETA